MSGRGSDPTNSDNWTTGATVVVSGSGDWMPLCRMRLAVANSNARTASAPCRICPLSRQPFPDFDIGAKKVPRLWCCVCRRGENIVLPGNWCPGVCVCASCRRSADGRGGGRGGRGGRKGGERRELVRAATPSGDCSQPVLRPIGLKPRLSSDSSPTKDYSFFSDLKKEHRSQHRLSTETKPE